MPNNTEYAINQLPELVKRAVIAAILDRRPLREIGKMAGVDPKTVMKYRDEVVMPNVTANSYTAKELTPPVSSNSTPLDQGLVKTRVDALWQRTEKALSRVESRADEDFSGREWAAVATVAHRNAELMGRLTGELQDKSGPGDINIQILMPATAKETRSDTIDVDVIKSIKSES